MLSQPPKYARCVVAMLFDVEYPGGERVIATGYPNEVLVVREVPRGPEACYLDELEVRFTPGHAAGLWEPRRVLRIVGGPRRPTLLVRVDPTARDAWMDAREREGWLTHDDPSDPSIVWVVADRDGLSASSLEHAGGAILAR